MISEKEVRRIAKLARLELTDKEIEKIQKDLSAILDYFNLLERAPKAEIVRGLTAYNNSAFREDGAVPQPREVAQKIISAAPDKKDGYIKAKTVL